jgi:hypothetical protein
MVGGVVMSFNKGMNNTNPEDRQSRAELTCVYKERRKVVGADEVRQLGHPCELAR